VNKQRKKKEIAVGEIRERLSRSPSAVLTDYRGLTVGEATRLRSQLREAGVEFKVLKNTLTKRAADEVGITGLETYLEGPTAIAFSSTDPVAPAKILLQFIKTAKKMEIKAGILEGKVIDPDGVKALADLPSREELLAKLAGSMKAPLYGLASVLAGPMRNFVYALDQIRQQKEAS